jgi:GT2 family glycosyltransferase
VNAHSLFIAIVNYRTGQLTVNCLESLCAIRDELNGGRVVVIDNASGDDSVEIIQSAIQNRGWSAWIELLPMPRNGGFSYGNNAAVKRIQEIFPTFSTVLLLNPDTLARPGVLQ